MSIADHFERVSEPSLLRDFHAQTARRQFNTSLILLAVVAAVTLALGLIVSFEPAAAPQGEIQQASTSAPPSYVGRL